MFSETSLNLTSDVANATQNMPPPAIRSSVAISFRMIIILTDALLTIGGNLIGMLLICRTDEIPDGTKVCMLSLSSSDFCIGLLALLSLAPAYLGHWPYGDAYCHANVLIASILCGVTILSLLTISLDRYVAVVWPLRYHSIMTQRKAISVSVVIWIVSIIMNIPVWLHQSGIAYVDEAALCLMRWTDAKTVPMFVVSSFSASNVPIIVISCLYYRIISISRVHAMRISAVGTCPQISVDQPANPQDTSHDSNFNANAGRKAPKRMRNHKSIRMFCVVALGYAVAWLPYCILTALEPTDVHVPDWAAFLSLWLLMSNSWWNVLIYVGMNKHIRRSASKMFERQRRDSLVRRNSKTTSGVITIS